MSQRDYNAEGRRAFERGEPASKNPYRFGRPFWNWSQGWVDAWWASPAGQEESARLNAAPATQEGSDKSGKEGGHD